MAPVPSFIPRLFSLPTSDTWRKSFSLARAIGCPAASVTRVIRSITMRSERRPTVQPARARMSARMPRVARGHFRMRPEFIVPPGSERPWRQPAEVEAEAPGIATERSEERRELILARVRAPDRGPFQEIVEVGPQLLGAERHDLVHQGLD